MCAAMVGWHNLRVAGGSAGGVVGQKKHISCELISNVRVGGCMSTRAIPRSSMAKAPWTKGSPIFWLPRAKSKQPLPIDSNPSFAVKFCHVLFSWTSKMPLHCTEHQGAFFTKHLLRLTHAGVIPFVKTNDISRILSENGISRISSKNDISRR